MMILSTAHGLLLALSTAADGLMLIAAARIAAAALGGLAVGTERQWSGHAQAHFAGVRTFTLLGGVGGVAGWLFAQGAELPAAVLLRP
jgi:hypothetical protein